MSVGFLRQVEIPLIRPFGHLLPLGEGIQSLSRRERVAEGRVRGIRQGINSIAKNKPDYADSDFTL
jgi:hypothetical protein